ncbi:MAG: GCN5-related N-acetyltransferase [Sporomusa sp.]|nr:GCN5-related N-acetyltransferase [Sporomusa sp.]
MNILDRIASRIQNEGLVKTIKYLGYAGWNEVKITVKDAILDLKYSGRLLRGHLPTAYKHLGANDVYHTEYSAMDIIFSQVNIRPHDVLVDVGCGKGRVINYWLSQGYTNTMYGLEIDPLVAQETAEQFSAWPNVNIAFGDAIKNLPPDGSIFYLYNPFSCEKFYEFESQIAKLAQTNKITLVYYRPKSLLAFDNGQWHIRLIDFDQDLGIQQWGRLNKYHKLAIITPLQ